MVLPVGELVSAAEAATILGWSRSKVNRLAQTGDLPHAVKMPGGTGAYLFDRATLEQIAEVPS